MAFIPPISLIYSVLMHPYASVTCSHSDTYDTIKSNDNGTNNKKNDEIKKDKKKQIELPEKCNSCPYRKGMICSVENKDLIEINLKNIEECSKPEEFNKYRQKLKKAEWSLINQILLKEFLVDCEANSEAEIIFNNLENAYKIFKPWELLTMLSHDQICTLTIKYSTYEDYFNTVDKYYSFLESNKDNKTKTELTIKEEDLNQCTCDFATILLLKNFLSRFEDNETISCIENVLENVDSSEDIHTIIEILREDNFLTLKTFPNKTFQKTKKLK